MTDRGDRGPAEPAIDACGCDAFASIFDRRTAARDRERYRRDGPDLTTRLLLELLAPYRSTGVSLLDIGGGIGIVDVELLRAGAGRAVLVDASTAYLDEARRQARQAGVLDRIEFVEGDFVRQAESIEPADIVTLDRVVCCYPDMEALVGLSSERARTAYGLVLPRDRRITRLAIALINATYRLRRRAYRAYVHPTSSVDEIAAGQGLEARAERHTWIWRVVVYDRALGAASAA
jgi:2-polyprenyl-3-methyl-5-hydroxy-6-metoxy-1,4-benzoquinol methylase